MNLTARDFVIRPMQAKDVSIVSDMIKALYRTLQAPDDYVTDKKISATMKQLGQKSEYLELDVFEKNNAVVAYALLFKYWYNEYGGMVLNIDELFVNPEFRSLGIVSAYLTELAKRQDDHVALTLEVLPTNTGAFSLYKRLGFEQAETVKLYKALI